MSSKIIGQVMALEGAAEVKTTNGVIKILSSGDMLYDGEIVITKADASVNIVFLNGIKLEIEANEEILLEESVHRIFNFENKLVEGNILTELQNDKEIVNPDKIEEPVEKDETHALNKETKFEREEKEGKIDVELTLMDDMNEAGNISPKEIESYTDTTAPNAPVINTPVVNGDGSLSITGTGEPESTVTLEFSDGEIVTAVVRADGTYGPVSSTAMQTSGDISASQTDEAGNTSVEAIESYTDITAPNAPVIDTPVVNGDGSLSITGTGEPKSTVTLEFSDGEIVTAVVRADGTYGPVSSTAMQTSGDISASQTDEAGNTSVEAIESYTDITAPNAPVIDTPVVNGDGSLSITGTGEPESTVQLTFSDGEIVTAVVRADGTYGPVSSTAMQTSGDISASQTDEAGNTSVEAIESYTDITAPNAPVIDTPVVNGDGSLSITGTGEPESTVTLEFSDGEIVTAVVRADGTYGPVSSTAMQTSGDISASQTDEAGNTSVEAIESYTDITAPNAPVIDTPVVNGDGSLSITGTGEPKSTVTLEFSDGEIVTAVVRADGTYGPVSSTAMQTSGDISASQTDEAGNTSVEAIESYTDITAPNAPVIDTPVVNGDGSLSITGTGEPESTVQLTFSDGEIVTAVVRADGTYGPVSSTAMQTSGDISATQTDEAGNTSVEAIESYTDITAPNAPVIDTPVVNGDGTLSITGTGEPESTVQLTFSDGEIVTAVVRADGTYGPVSSTAMQTSGDISASQTDEAGNTSVEAIESYTDTTAPNAPVIDTPVVNGDGTLSITGTGEPESTVQLTFSDGEIVTAVVRADGTYGPVSSTAMQTSGDISASQTDEAGNTSVEAIESYTDTTAPNAPVIDTPVVNGDGTLSITGTGEPESTVQLTFSDGEIVTAVVRADGTYGPVSSTAMQTSGDISASQTDEAGNTSVEAIESYTDITAPNAPVIDTPVVNGDGTLSITGTGEPESTVQLTFSDGEIVTAVVRADGTYGPVSSTAMQTSGDISATQTDEAGNTSVEAIESYTDTTAPNAPVIDTPVVNGDGTLSITGTGEPESTVQLTFSDGEIVTAVVRADGTYGPVSSTAVQTSGDISATQTDEAGNTSVEAIESYTDITAPNAPVIDTPVVNGDGSLSITGTGEPKSTVTLEFSDGEIVTAVVRADGTYGPVSSTAMQTSGDISASQTDEAGNTSVEAIESYTDITAPNAPVIDTPVVNGDGSLSITGTGEPESTVQLTFSDGEIVTAVVRADGTYGPVSSTAMQTSGDISATQTDEAGNTSVEAIESYTDITAPNAPVIDTPVVNGDGTLSITGTGEPESTVQLTFSDGEIVTAVVRADGTYGPVSSTAVQTSGDISATQTDEAGNTSVEAIESYTDITVSTNTINITSITNDSGIASNDFITNDQNLQISGTLANVLVADERIQINIEGNWIDVSSQPGTGTTWSHDYTGTTLANGTYNVEARVVDTSMNIGSLTTQDISIDSIQPDTPILVLERDTGSFNNDAITNDGTVNVGNLEAGATWQYTTDSGVTWTNGVGTSFILAEGTYTENSIQARQIDTAGNVSNNGHLIVTPIFETSTVGEVDSGSISEGEITTGAPPNVEDEPFSVLIDMTTPVMLAADRRVLFEIGGNHTGTSLSYKNGNLFASVYIDNDVDIQVNNVIQADTRYEVLLEITRNSNNGADYRLYLREYGAPNFTEIGSHVEADSMIFSGTNEGGIGVVGSSIQGREGNDSFMEPFDGTLHGVSTFRATLSDNPLILSVGESLIVDTTPPIITINTVATDDVVDAVEKIAGVTISGTTNAEENQELIVNWGGIEKTAIVQSNGTWSVNYASGDIPNDAAVTTITANVIDIAGNPAVEKTHNVEVDTRLVVGAVTDSDTAINQVDENAAVGTEVGVTALATDTFGDAIDVTYSLSNDAGGLFTIDETTGVVKVASNIDYEKGVNVTLHNLKVNPMVQLEAIGNSSSFDYAPQITRLANGEYVVTFTGADSNGDDSIFVQKFNVDGTTQGAMVQLEAIGNSVGSDKSPEITALANGEYAVTFYGRDSDGDDSIFVQKFNADGTTQGAMVQLEAIGETLKDDFAPKIATLANGEYAVTFYGWDSILDRSVYVQKFNADGTTQGAMVQLEAIGNSVGNDYYSEITALANGEYAVTFYGRDSDGDNSIFVQKFNADGTTQGAMVQLEAIGSSSGSDSTPKITALANGEYAVTFYGSDSDGDISIFVQKFNADGTTQGAMVQLEAIGNNVGSDYYPEITALANGEYAVTFYGRDSDGDDSIFVQKFNADGTTQGAMVQLEAIGNSSGNDYAPKITALVNGEYAVTFYGPDSDGDNSIFVQKFNADGTTQGAMVQLEAIGNSLGNDYETRITALANGEYAVTFYGQDSNGDNSIFVQKFNADGTIHANTGDIVADFDSAVANTTYTYDDTSGYYSLDGITGDVTLTQAGADFVNGGGILPTFTVTSTSGLGVTQTLVDIENNTSEVTYSSAYNIEVTATDATDNTAIQSMAITVNDIVVDKPVISGISGDDGQFNNDGITSDTTLTINGTGIDGSTVSVYRDSALAGTTTVSGGTWSFNDGKVHADEDKFDYTATASFKGEVSSLSDPFSVNIETDVLPTPRLDNNRFFMFASSDPYSSLSNYEISGTVDTRVFPAGEEIAINIFTRLRGLAIAGERITEGVTAVVQADGTFTVTADVPALVLASYPAWNEYESPIADMFITISGDNQTGISPYDTILFDFDNNALADDYIGWSADKEDSVTLAPEVSFDTVAGDGVVSSLEDDALVLTGTVIGGANIDIIKLTFSDGVNADVIVSASINNGVWTSPAVNISGLEQGNITVTSAFWSRGTHEFTESANSVTIEHVTDPSLNIVAGDVNDNTLNGTSGSDYITGFDGDDTLLGGGDIDILIGGAGSDTLTGGTGSDTFKFNAGDDGTVATPAEDIITDFESGLGGDVLDISDLLVGEDSNDIIGLDSYIHFEQSGPDTIITIDKNGTGASNSALSNATQKITLTGVDLTSGGTLSDQDILNTLLTNNQLIVD